jgi:two-component system chemotaxis response regulator CheB
MEEHRKEGTALIKKNPFAKDFPVVCVGGSVGGLDAYIRLLKHLPADTGVAVIIPTNRDLHVLDGEFHLKPISKPWGWPDVITIFLRSLAQHWDGQLIAVIVSGLDGDGAAALGSIREAGGITIAQMPDTAAEPGMPQSAIESGFIDFILSAEDIAKELVRIAHASAVKAT